MLLDCITQVTETKDKFPGLPLGARAVADRRRRPRPTTSSPPSAGRRGKRSALPRSAPSRRSRRPCTCSTATRSSRRSLPAALVKRMLEPASRAPRRSSRRLYVRCLCREPTPDEMARLPKLVEGEENRQAALEDIFWALLNSREFCSIISQRGARFQRARSDAKGTLGNVPHIAIETGVVS